MKFWEIIENKDDQEMPKPQKIAQEQKLKDFVTILPEKVA